ncbi:TNF receptor-associated factor family protein DDB_G0272098-like [Scylla paramamosain]|uniref:TNF receptor-associated factor family protein DDB_G0272098-like n=1 Tax=Scylla paramamosain TaxID=85552 RepID=UPI0030835616
MVVTRKRSCSASEASSTPRGVKARKQDEGGGGDGTTITTRSSARGEVESGTGTSTTITTPRRTRRFTDSIAEAVISSPRTLRTRQGRSGEAKVSDKSESSNDEVAEKVDSAVSQPGKSRSGRNEVEATPAKEKSAGDKTACVDSSVLSQPSKLMVKLRDIGPSILQSPRPRRVSGGDKNTRDTPSGTPSTPVRRSRRLSGSGVEEVPDKETLSKKSFTIASILRMEEKPKEETSKASVLPAIEEDIEQPESNHSPSKDTRKAYSSEEDQMEEEEKLELRLESDSHDSTADNDVVPSDTAPTNQEAENEKQTIVDQPVAADVCDSKDVPVENVNECDSKDAPFEKEAQEKTSSEAMETTEITSTTDVTDIERSNNTAMETKEEQDVVLSLEEPKCESTKVMGSNDSQESKTESTDLPESNDNERSNNTAMETKEEQDVVLSLEEPKCESTKVMGSNDSQESKTESTDLPESNDNERSNNTAMETEEEQDAIRSIKEPKCENTKVSGSNDIQESKTESTNLPDSNDNERSNNTAMETEEEQDAVLSVEEPNCESTKVIESNGSQESKTESTDLPESNDIQERTETSIACSDMHTTSKTSDENGNSAEMNSVNGLLSVVAGGKKVTKVIPELEKKINQLRSIPKGRPISGRWWKAEKQRFRSINKDATGKKSWSKKMQLKQWRGDVMAKSAVIEAEKQKKKEDLKERQRINKIRREENAKKSEIVQVIKDPRKIKKMKRKQLRYLEMRDTTNLKQA